MSTRTTTTERPFKTEFYSYQSKNVWPGRGQHILAQFDEDTVIVYQAFRPEIAQYAVENQRFDGCSLYKPSRMTWIKTNFLWMTFRSGWAHKPGQERILAIWLRRARFDHYLACARTKGSVRGERGTVRLQWDPDHVPNGDRHPYRRAVQLGLRDIKGFASGEDIVQISDVTDFVHEQSKMSKKEKDWEELLVASERVYVPDRADAIEALDLSLEG